MSRFLHNLKDKVTVTMRGSGLRIAIGGLLPALAATFFLPSPAQAIVDLTQINLVLGGEAATGWSISGIMPCESGTRTVTLTNEGELDGFVTIWISDIQSTEGQNPESETETTGEGELDDHLLLGVSTDPADRLDTNVVLPTTIENLPQSFEDTNYIHVTPLDSGETVTLYWDWELPCETGNEAQGDCLSFTINYVLEDIPEPPTITQSRGLSCPSCYMEIDMLGEIAEIDIGCCSNQTLHSYEPSDPDDMHYLLIDSATAVICGDTADCGKYPRIIVMRVADDPAREPENGVFIGPVYDFTGYGRRNWEASDCPVCDTVTFGQPISALIGYDPDDLPEGAFTIGIYVFDPELGEWVLTQPVPGVVAEVGRASGRVNHFSQLAVIAKAAEEPTPPETIIPGPEQTIEPAHFTISDLSIRASEVRTGIGKAFVLFLRKGERVNIAANIANDGGQGDIYTAALKLNGEVTSSQIVNLQPGQGQEVVFTVSDIEPGQYEVQIGDRTGHFEVVIWTNWWLIAGIATACGLLIWGIWYLAHRRKGKA